MSGAMPSPDPEEAACVEDDEPLSSRLDMLEQAPSANAKAITEPRRSPAANRAPVLDRRVNRRIPASNVRWGRLLPLHVPGFQRPFSFRCRKPGGSVTA